MGNYFLDGQFDVRNTMNNNTRLFMLLITFDGGVYTCKPDTKLYF